MKTQLLVAACAALALSAGAVEAKPGKHITAAVADAARPEADTRRDADRKPAEMLEFAGVKKGMKVADFIPGGGYFTRIFAKAVGPTGKVYAVTNPPPANAPNPPPIQAIAADPAYGNVQVVATGIASFALPEPVDVFWTSQNYHDLYLTRFNLDVPQADKAIFNAVKPGGTLVVLDHAAAPGAPVAETANTLHRIDPAAVRRNLEAAGFKYVGESKALANPADDHTKGVFDPALRGHTDQFILKFRKPK
ncbi:methyltransferase [Phenylobacterium sp.]|uniref:class I SAM-dependent methyltransferase n=1 Tax=Phenylobacterium sp. TaxID=1871053 RepID=UPI002C295A45|nr:methyltransferase [Phenylobacterium sp.]HVI30866.1 methyltransferase [Phenylobacterium sp.]